MGKWVDLIVVSTLLVAAGANQSPNPHGYSSARFGLISPDGSYNFNYETDSSAREENADSNLNVRGSYSFRADDGQQRTVRYRAGSGTGFVAEGAHFPISPEVPSGSSRPSSSAPSPSTYSASTDGSYSFNYDTDSSAREESADSRLNVKGRYSFRGDDGQQRTVQYRAGAGTGFVAEGAHLPASPEVPSGSRSAPVSPSRSSPSAPSPSTYSASPAQVTSSASPDGSYNFNYETDSSAREESADSRLNVKGRYSFRGDDGQQRTVQYRAGAGTGFVAEGTHLPESPEVPSGSRAAPASPSRPSPSAPSPSTYSGSPAQVKSSASPDGSYSFNYETDTSAREESADSNLNVKGRYSFRGNDGQQRTVQYRAGAGTGFVAEGTHLPESPEVPSGSRAAPASPSRPSPSAPSPSTYSGSPAQVKSSASPDGSYSFNYETDSSAREESADSRLNVKGRYSFRGDDGQQRTVQYRAGAGTGFVAEGTHLPESPEVPSGSRSAPASPSRPSPSAPSPSTYSGSPAQVKSSASPDGSYSFNYETDSSTREESADSRLNVKGRYSFRGNDGQQRTVQYRAGAGTGFVAEGTHLPESPEVPSGSRSAPASPSRPSPSAPSPSTYSGSPAQVKSSASPDGSYSFNYETDSSAREESADSRLNVKGRYSFRGDDGQQRTVQYRAGAGTGFVAEGTHLPESPEVPSGSRSAPASPSRPSPSAPSPSTYSGSPAQVKSSASPDGSYSFNYETDSSAREESADSRLNVKGRYSFRGDDGQQRTVQYRAGAGTGFVAEGTHLPESPEVPSGSRSAPVSPSRLSPSAPSPSTYSGSPAQVKSSASPDGSYSFNYETDTSAREESADSNLNVKGRYSFRGNDGQQRTVQYRAGAGTGFVAEGTHLPESPEVPSGSRAAPASPSRPSPSAPSPSTYSGSPAQVKSSASPDGSYSFNYETDSSAREESADSRLNVRGRYSFRGDDGQQRTVQYRAGAGTGFVAEGTHLPESPEVPSGSRSAPVSPSRPSPSAPSPSTYSGSPAQVKSSASPDGSYSFNYETDSSAREETADSNLNVKGRYSFRGDDGQRRTVQYRAGAGTGFVAEGTHLPESPEVPSGSRSASISPSGSSPSAPSPSTYSGSPAQVKSSASPDGSYNFNYETDTSAREESADSNLNVKGRYSFRGDDGQRRTVQYRAGAGTGFVAEGTHLPESPEVPSGSRSASISPSGSSPSAPSPSTYSGSPAQVKSSASPDGSYNFNYETDTSAREESADSNLNVKGRYSFRGDDGQRRTVQYRAGAGTGFVAEGTHLPESPEVPSGSSSPLTYSSYQSSPAGLRSSSSSDGSYSFSYDADSSAREENADSNLNVKGRYSFRADDGQQRTVRYSAGAGTGFVAHGTHLPVGGTSDSVGFSAKAGGYRFGYETDSSAREENADANLNVRGTYSFQAADGVRRIVTYRAGSNTGFVAQGNHLPVAN